MERTEITSKQASAMIAVFIVGNTLATAGSSASKQDEWLVVLVGLVFALVLTWGYALLLQRFPGYDLFQICQKTLGGLLGGLVGWLFVFYFLQIAAMALRSFTEFIEVVSLPETPQFIMVIPFGLTCLFFAKSKLSVLGKFSKFMLPVIIGSTILTTILLVKEMVPEFILPVLGQTPGQLLLGGFSLSMFPMGEVVVFMTILPKVHKGAKPARVFSWGILLGAGIILLGNLRNIFVLGAPTLSRLYFPSYTAVGLINIGNFLTRIEALVSGIFLAGGVVRVCVCVYAATLGIARLLGIEQRKALVAPVTLLVMMYACFIFGSTMEMFDFTPAYKYFCGIFQLALPVLLLLFSIGRKASPPPGAQPEALSP